MRYFLSMEILWDPGKYQLLKSARGIDLDEIKNIIENKDYLEVTDHPTRKDQILIIIDYKSYAHVVIAKLEQSRIIIKTCYPSRKYKKVAGG